MSRDSDPDKPPPVPGSTHNGAVTTVAPTVIDEGDHPGWGPDTRPSRPALRSRLLTLDQLADRPPARPLIGGLLYAGTLAQLAGTAGSFKTFVTVAFSVSIALGKNLDDYRVPQARPVVYVAAEGAEGIRKRVLAYCELAGYDPPTGDQFLVLPDAVQLGSPLAVAELRDAVHDLGAGLVVLDTRARCTVGLEENSATEQGRAIAACDTITALGCTVLAAHHTPRNGTAGRGSTAWDGAVWSDLRLTHDGLTAEIECAKHKEVPDGCRHPFRLVPHTVSPELLPGATEDQRSTLVAISADNVRPAQVDHRTGQIVLRIVLRCASPEGLRTNEIRDLAIAEGATKSPIYAAIKKLRDQGILVNVGTKTTPRLIVSPSHSSKVETQW